MAGGAVRRVSERATRAFAPGVERTRAHLVIRVLAQEGIELLLGRRDASLDELLARLVPQSHVALACDHHAQVVVEEAPQRVGRAAIAHDRVELVDVRGHELGLALKSGAELAEPLGANARHDVQRGDVWGQHRMLADLDESKMIIFQT